MLLILCSITDTDALWFAEHVRRAGVPVKVVTGELLAFARRRSHRLGRGGVHTTIELGDGTLIADASLTGVLNRLVEAPAAAWANAAVDERHYATAELHAFTLSWLSSLTCPVRNRPEPTYLAGLAPHPLRALAAAHSAGLPAPSIRFDTSTATTGPEQLIAAIYSAAQRAAGPEAEPVQLVCLDGEPWTPLELPDDLVAGIGDTLRLIGADTSLIGLDFFVSPSRRGRPSSWSFAGVAGLARLRNGGPALARRLSAVLTAGAPVRIGAGVGASL